MFRVIISFVLFACAFSMPAEDAADEAKLDYKETVRNLQSLVRRKGCQANVCFAIDTSGSVDGSDFEFQKDFILDITAIIGEDPATKFAATQYGKRIYSISKLTGDISTFNWRVDAAQFQNDIRTNVGSGIVWCDAVLRKQKHDVNKIVIIGDGRNNLGGSPAKRAKIFRERADNGFVCAVGVGFANKRALRRITGSSSLVFTVHDYFELSHLVNKLVENICGFSIGIFD